MKTALLPSELAGQRAVQAVQLRFFEFFMQLRVLKPTACMNSPTLAEGVRAATSLRGQAGFPWVSSQGGLSVCSSKPPALHGADTASGERLFPPRSLRRLPEAALTLLHRAEGGCHSGSPLPTAANGRQRPSREAAAPPWGVAARLRALASHWLRARKGCRRLRSERRPRAVPWRSCVRRWRRRRRGRGAGSRRRRSGTRRRWRRRRCRGSRTGWTCGSSSSSTWRCSCSSTCCPEVGGPRAGQGRAGPGVLRRARAAGSP